MKSKMRRSTVILLVSWILLMVLYVLVRPEPPAAEQVPVPVETVQETPTTTAPG